MARIKIPEKYLVGIKYISESSLTEVEKIAGVLNSLPINTAPPVFLNEIGSVISSNQQEEIARTIYSFGSLLLQESDINTAVKKLTEAFFEQSGNVGDEGALEKKLSIIFAKADSLKLRHKAAELLSENGNLFSDARIYTDIRIVFNNEIDKSEKCAVLIHRLKIEHLEGGNETETFFSLDQGDLEKLKKQVDRALLKQKSIIEDYSNTFKFIE